MPTLLTFLIFSFAIVQQPYAAYVAPQSGVVTQFSLVQNGDVALLAHVEQAGAAFDELMIGDVITLHYETVNKRYVVDSTERYWALDPLNPYGNYRSVETDLFISGNDLYHLIYGIADRRLILQTCFDGSNGRLFVIAYPINYFYGRYDL